MRTRQRPRREEHRQPPDRGGPPEHAAAPLRRQAALARRAGAARRQRHRRRGRARARRARRELEPDELRRARSSIASSAPRSWSSRRAPRAASTKRSRAPRARCPRVAVAAPALRENVALQGTGGRDSVQLLGVGPSVTALGGLDTRDLGGFHLAGGLVLPASVARAIGAEAGQTITVLAGGAAQQIRVATVLGGSSFGVLSSSPIAVTLLKSAQRLTGLSGRVSEVLIKPRAGADRRGRARAAVARRRAHRRRPRRQRAAPARRGRRAQRPVDVAVRRDQRDGRLPARAQRDAADRPRAAAVRRRPAHPGL